MTLEPKPNINLIKPDIFKSIFDKFPQSVAFLDVNGNVILKNHDFNINILKIYPDIIKILKEDILSKAYEKSYTNNIREIHFKYRQNNYFYSLNYVPIKDLSPIQYIVTLIDITNNIKQKELLIDMNEQIEKKIIEINETQIKMMNQDKLVGIGQLAAGVAHEINNPLGYVISNFSVLDNYFNSYTEIILKFYDLFEKNISENQTLDNNECDVLKKKIDRIFDMHEFDFIKADYTQLYLDTMGGLERISKIVKSLKNFSRIDDISEFTEYQLNNGIEETLIIANNEIKYYADIVKELSELPEVFAIGSEINQVILNVLLNSVHAIREKESKEKGRIIIRTFTDDEFIYCEIEDNGMGIKNEDKNKVFIPFFTTKDVGKGTGLGMSITFDIIKNKHKGEVYFKSTYGIGTIFTFKLPLFNDR